MLLLVYLLLGAVNTGIRLWLIIRWKIGSWPGMRWKSFWLTVYIIEQTLIWPLEILCSIAMCIFESVNKEKYIDVVVNLIDLVTEEYDD